MKKRKVICIQINVDLYTFQNNLTFYEKQKYMHLSRWYNQVTPVFCIRLDLNS